MTGLGLRLSTDEDVAGQLAADLRMHGYDVVRCHEAGNSNQRYPDSWQLAIPYTGRHTRHGR